MIYDSRFTKRLAVLAVSSFFILHSALATTVLFPLQLMTGNKHNRTILIQPDISTNQIVNGTNLVGQLPIVVTPTNGVGRAVLLPWSYTVRVDGWPKSFHIGVPDSTNVLNACTLITNAVAVGTNVWAPPVAIVTNYYTVSNTVITYTYQTNITAVTNALTVTYQTNYAWVYYQAYTNTTLVTNDITIYATNTVNLTNAVTVNTTNVFTLTNGIGGITTSNSPTVTFTGDGTSTNPLVATVATSLTNGLASQSYVDQFTNQVTATSISNNLPSQVITNLQATPTFTTGLRATNSGTGTYALYAINSTTATIQVIGNGGIGTFAVRTNGNITFGSNVVYTNSTFQGNGGGLTNIPTSALVREVRWVDALASGINVAASPTEAPHLIILPGASFADGMAFDHGDIGSFSIQALHVAASTNTDFPQFYYEPHVHVSPAVFVAGQTNTTWVMEWQVARVFHGFTNTVTLLATNTVGFTNLNHHQILSFGNYTNNALQGAASIIFRGGVKRIASASNDVGDAENVILDSVDFHVPTRAVGFGSTSQYSGE